MGLIMADNILNYARNYKVVFVDGRYGSGKTSFAFILAYELSKRFGFRYILSNVASVWTTPLEDVQLREDRYIDAVFVLDEGGLYLDSPGAAKAWMPFLRKLNVVLIIPSVYPPSTILQKLTVQRLYNLGVFGVPLWWYGCFLRSGRNKADDRFFWWQPSGIFGIYDTDGMPDEADEQLVKLRGWTKQAQQVAGYSKNIQPHEVEQLFVPEKHQRLARLENAPVQSSGLRIVDPGDAQAEMYEQMQEVVMMNSALREELDSAVSQIKRVRR